jgi:hypothetical protein
MTNSTFPGFTAEATFGHTHATYQKRRTRQPSGQWVMPAKSVGPNPVHNFQCNMNLCLCSLANNDCHDLLTNTNLCPSKQLTCDKTGTECQCDR